ncbi:hypothetical protein BJ875DRAFT_519630 [Amylocarpus encephaloides]|uniref:BTB domain-containing protein n=1 Tax=Amylocarpus encephaloides TaxID=45428 RepID=A0A9P7YQZ1_9HELO|nr:hypothetical protein BJ875DRAFT_519630 [Amylocarpus encephaloides]
MRIELNDLPVTFQRLSSKHQHHFFSTQHQKDNLQASRSIRDPERYSSQGPHFSESTLVTLLIGPEKQPFYIHKEKLTAIPYFAKAFRLDAFLEGYGTITLEEEDPQVFRCVFDFIYTMKFSPLLIYDENCPQDSYDEPIFMRRIDSEVSVNFKRYCGDHQRKLLSGLWVLTDDSENLLNSLLGTLCVADRYGMDELLKICDLKLDIFPCGCKETTMVTEFILENITKTQKLIHDVLFRMIRWNFQLLRDFEPFWAQFKKQDSINPNFPQMLSNLVQEVQQDEKQYFAKEIQKNNQTAICILDVEEAQMPDTVPEEMWGKARVGDMV